MDCEKADSTDLEQAAAASRAEIVEDALAAILERRRGRGGNESGDTMTEAQRYRNLIVLTLVCADIPDHHAEQIAFALDRLRPEDLDTVLAAYYPMLKPQRGFGPPGRGDVEKLITVAVGVAA